MDSGQIGILFLLAGVVAALIPAFIASSKGRDFFLWFVYGLFLNFIALIHAIILRPNENAKGMKKCPECASVIPGEASICPACRSSLTGKSQQQPTSPVLNNQEADFFQGERDTSSPKYQLHLTKRYRIERNNTLQKFVIDDDVFNTLEDAISAAHGIEEVEISNIKEQEKVAQTAKVYQYEKMKMERAESVQRYEKERLEAQKQWEALAPVRKAKQRNEKVIIGVCVAIVIAIISAFGYRSHLESRQKELEVKQRQAELDVRNEQRQAELDNRNELIRRTNPILSAMFSKPEIFGMKIGVSKLSDLNNIVPIQLPRDRSQSEILGYYNLRFNGDEIEKLVGNREVATRVVKLTYSFCVKKGTAGNLSDRNTYKNIILNGISLELEDFEAAQIIRAAMHDEKNGGKSVNLYGTAC